MDGLERRVAVFQIAVDILDHHDGIVDPLRPPVYQAKSKGTAGLPCPLVATLWYWFRGVLFLWVGLGSRLVRIVSQIH